MGMISFRVRPKNVQVDIAPWSILFPVGWAWFIGFLYEQKISA